MNKIFIVWDGCDGYRFAADLEDCEYKKSDQFWPFEVVEITREPIPLLDGGDEGEQDFDGVFMVGNRYFRISK